MIITCEQCNTAFNLDERLLKSSGSKVRCSKCRHIFTAYPPSAPEQAPSFAAPAMAPPPGPSAAEDEFDLSDLESSLGEPEEPSAEQEDLDLGLDLGSADAEAAAPDEGEFDLSDLDLEEDDEEAAEAPAAGDEGELDFSDLDLDIGEAAPEEAPAAEAPAGEDELDLSDLDLDLGGLEEEAPAEAAGAETGDEGELDLGDLDLDLGGSLQKEAPEVPSGGEDELDLGDLEFDLGEAEEAAPAAAAEAPGADEGELDLGDLELDFGEAEEAAPAAAAEAPGADEGELDLGDLDLDLGGDEKDRTPEPKAAAEDELDISEFERVLDEDDDGVDTGEELDVDDLDLDFELEPIEEGDVSEGAELEMGSDDEEIDLSELETMLEGQDDEQEALDAEMPSQQFDLDLDLDMEEPEEASEEMELDLEAEDIDAAFGDEDIEDLDAEELETVEPGEGRSATFAETVDMETLEREAAALEAEGAAGGPGTKAASKPRKAKRKLGKPLLVLLLLAVLGGGGYYAVTTMGIRIPFLSDIRIPYLSDLISPAPDNVNRIEVMQATVRSKFVDNAKTGKLFVITGRIRNGYKEARNFIGVTGNLFAKGKKVRSASVFAGNSLSDAQLSAMDINAINKSLRNRIGEKKSNMNVRPDQTLPFMIVFDKLPAQLEEFTVEPGTSTSAQ